MNGATYPTKAALVPRRPRGPFPTRDLRQLQAMGAEILRVVLEQGRRPDDSERSAS